MTSMAIRAHASPIRFAAALAAGLGVVAAITVAAVSARHATLADVSPVIPSGHWGSAWLVAVTAAVCLSCVGWLLARRGMSLRLALAVAVAVQVIPLTAPLLLSKDAYLYWAAARIVTVHHANPYVATLENYPNDPSFPYPSESWRPYPVAYGPAWEAISTAPATLAGTSANRAQLAYRILAVLGVLAIIGIVARRTRSASAVALVGWSPLVALHYAGGGHSDALMMAFLVFAVAARSAAAGGAWAIAGAFKPIPVILVPLELASARFRLGKAWWIGLVATTSVIAVASTAVFGVHWFVDQARGIHRGVGYPTPLGVVHWLVLSGISHGRAVLVAGALFALIYVVLFRDAWKNGRARLSIAAAALVMTSTLLGPWYGLWPLALAAVEDDLFAGGLAAAVASYLVLADAVKF